MVPKACSTAMLCHESLSGTVYAPQIAPWQQGWHWGTPSAAPAPQAALPEGYPLPCWAVRGWAGEDSLPCLQDAGQRWQDGIWGSGSSPGTALEAPHISGSSFDGVEVLVRQHCRQESDGQEAGGLLTPAFCLIGPDIPLAPGSLTLLCFLFISTGQETADL